MSGPTLCDPVLDLLAEESEEEAREWMLGAEARRTRAERRSRARVARLVAAPEALAVVLVLTDEVMRASSRDAVAALRRVAGQARAPGFSLLDRSALRLAAGASRLAPGLVGRLVRGRVRALAGPMILDAEPRRLRAHLARRTRAGLLGNVNVLGEAVLGEGEAERRLERVIEMIGRPEVSFVSVKLSSVMSQIVAVDEAGSRERAAERLRRLYRAAAAHGVLVTLDMEEYRDLRLSVDAALEVLDEPEFAALDAGIVLQAYLPDSHGELESVLAWARRRHERGGATFKVRLVKGANLAMESAEAQIHGWTPAPYPNKASVDASYARMIDVALRREWGPGVRIGVASHNLLHLSWARGVAAARGIAERLDVEMLEGMADAEARVLAASGQRVLLYTPVTARDDFVSALAYLVRRLDENTAPENYLSAAFSLAHDPGAWAEQCRRFRDSLSERHHVSTASRRHGPHLDAPSGLATEPDGDPTDPAYRAAWRGAWAAVATESPEVGSGADLVDSIDPNTARPWARYAVADAAAVEAAVARARAAGPAWEARGAERAEVLARAAQEIVARRARLLAVMARDTGKTVAEGDPEVGEAADFLRYYARSLGDLADSAPLGVVLVAPPWNFPLSIPVGGVAAALAAGNAVIVKPAPEAVVVCAEAMEALWAAGVPREVLQLVPTRDDEVGRRLVTHEGVDAVVLTGSAATAEMFLTWRPTMRLLAETSGKNAMVLSRRCDVDLAVRDLVHSAFSHAGQKCSAASLAIVEEPLVRSGPFLRQLRDAVESLVVGSAGDLATSVGPLIRVPEGPLERALSTLEPGESWLVEPRPLDAGGHLWRPGVKLGVAPGSWSHLTEWFGPVLGVMVAPDLATAVRWQNQVAYGLTAGLHTLDESEARDWIEAVEAGNLYVNRTTTGAVVGRQPFGGWKLSSVGPTAKAGGPHYVASLRDFSPLREVDSALEGARAWFEAVGSRSLDPAALEVEANRQRYRRARHPVAVRVEGTVEASVLAMLAGLIDLMGLEVQISCAVPLDAERVIPESVEELLSRASRLSRVRWLSGEPVPAPALLAAGVSVDTRPLAQRGEIEAPRWLLEQSVSVSAHRYGNRRAGPRPPIPGLGPRGSAPRW